MGFVSFNALRIGVAFGAGYQVGKLIGERAVGTLEAVAEELERRDLNPFVLLERAWTRR